MTSMAEILVVGGEGTLAAIEYILNGEWMSNG
jgi:hypothetical protein